MIINKFSFQVRCLKTYCVHIYVCMYVCTYSRIISIAMTFLNSLVVFNGKTKPSVLTLTFCNSNKIKIQYYMTICYSFLL